MHRVSVVGTGSIGERHVRCFQATGRAQVSVLETNAARRSQVAQRYGVPGASDWEEALAEQPAAAVICTPAPLHVEQATRLAEAGVHLLIEKPLGTSLEGVSQLTAVVAKRGLKAAVAYVYRCEALLVAMRAAIRDGRFGRPLELVAVWGQHFPTYRPAYRDIYYAERAQGGGAIQDALTHVLDIGQWLLGPIDSLVADAAHMALPGVPVEDTAHVLARHGEVLASYCLNQHQAPNESTVTVVCERGTVRWERHAHRWRWMTEPDGPWHEQTAAPPDRDTMFVAQAQAFLDYLEGRREAPCRLAEGVQTLRVNLAALASVTTRSWQAIERGGL
jgi:predicted dehydrogenase